MNHINEQLVKSTITGELVFAINFGGIVVYRKNLAAVNRYMKKLGYKYETWEVDGVMNGAWVKTKLSDAEVWLKQKFIHFDHSSPKDESFRDTDLEQDQTYPATLSHP